MARDNLDVESAMASPRALRTLQLAPGHVNVLLMENISSAAEQRLRNEGFNVDSISKLSGKELIEKIANVHVIGVRSKTKLTKEVLAHGRNLLAVGCFCIGTDQTDLDFAASRGIPVFNAPFANTRSVAEIVMSHIIALARHVGDQNMEMHRGVWQKVAIQRYEVRGKTVGIVGFGHVGSQLSIMAESLGMKVIFYDILPVLGLGNARAVPSLDELLSTADFVTLHVPLTEITKNMIGATEIAKMKKGSYLINYSRGKVCDVAAVADSLKKGHLGGAAFDVYPSEPATGEQFKSPLMGCPNTILTPHIGGSTEEAQSQIGIEVSEKIVQFVLNGTTTGAVNFPEVQIQASPDSKNTITNVHFNVPGVLRDINNCLSSYNISAQVVSTRGSIGYMVAHVDGNISEEACNKLAGIGHSIATRICQ